MNLIDFRIWDTLCHRNPPMLTFFEQPLAGTFVLIRALKHMQGKFDSLKAMKANEEQDRKKIESLSSRRFCHHGRQIAEEVWIDNGVFGAKF